MKTQIAVITLLASLFGAQSSFACSWMPPEESKVIAELETIGAAAVGSDPLKVNLLIEPVEESYVIDETNSTGMCPDAVHFSNQYAVRYEIDNGLATTCNVIITVTKTVPWNDSPKITYDVENLHVARCTR